MKKLGFGLLVTLLLTVFVAPALAWEFKMQGQFEWRYRYLGRANGYKDLFGDMRFQDNPATVGLTAGTGPIGFAGPNFWRGYNGNNASPMATNSWGSSVRVVRGGFSYADCDASEYDQRMTLEPVLRVNNAVYFGAHMDLAGIRQKYNHRDMQTNGPMDRWYQDRMSQNAFDTAMIPSINQYKLVCNMPWFTVISGTRNFPFGTGATLSLNVRSDSTMFIIPYGPLIIIPAFWWCLTPNGFGPFGPYASSSGPAPNTVVNMDKGTQNQIQVGPAVHYSTRCLDIGFLGMWFMNHTAAVNPGGAGTRGIYYNPLAPTPTVTYHYGGHDVAHLMWFVYMKYADGRFFANAEYAWVNLDQYYLPNATGSSTGGAPPLYSELNSFFSEVGAFCGPARLSLLFVRSDGPALNNGNPTKAYGGVPINYQVTDAYNYLLFHTYGGGNDAPWATSYTLGVDENGQLVDAFAFAARLDYAVAANLNIWGSYMWASRTEKNGWLAGSKNADGTIITTWNASEAQLWKHTAMPGSPATGPGGVNPYVDDAYLGWEAQLGVDWKLLENMSVFSRYAYWQPGPWFDQAYQVVGPKPGGSVGPTYSNGTQNNNDGAYLQGRSAIQAFSASIMIDF